MPASNPEYILRLGELMGGIKALSESMDRVLAWQEKSAQDAENSRRRIYDRLESHEREQAFSLHEIEQSVNSAKVQIQTIAETLEGHGSALVNLEQRVCEIEIQEKVRRENRRIFRRWLKGVCLAVATFFGGDQVAGGKILKAIASLFGGKSSGS